MPTAVPADKNTSRGTSVSAPLQRGLAVEGTEGSPQSHPGAGKVLSDFWLVPVSARPHQCKSQFPRDLFTLSFRNFSILDGMESQPAGPRMLYSAVTLQKHCGSLREHLDRGSGDGFLWPLPEPRSGENINKRSFWKTQAWARSDRHPWDHRRSEVETGRLLRLRQRHVVLCGKLSQARSVPMTPSLSLAVC